jgi:hypothetical protein
MLPPEARSAIDRSPFILTASSRKMKSPRPDPGTGRSSALLALKSRLLALRTHRRRFAFRVNDDRLELPVGVT